MTNRRLVTLIVLGLIGYGGLFFLFRKTNPAARWNFEMDRAAAIEIATAAAAAHGYTAPIRAATVKIEYHRDDEYYLSRQSNPLIDSLFTPLKARVNLADAQSGSGFEVRINSLGELLGYRLREPRKKKDGEKKDEPQTAQAPDALANEQKIADEALRRFLGNRYGKFSFLSGSNAGDEDRKFSWTAADDGLNVLAGVVVRDGKVKEVWLQSNLTPKFQEESDARRSGTIAALSSANTFLIFPAIILVVIFYFVSLARRRIDHRKTLVFLACAFLLLLVSNMFGSLADESVYNIRFNNNSFALGAGAVIRWALLIAVNLCTAAILYLFLAPGLALSSGIANRRTVDLELALKGKILRRPVMGSLVAGLLTGGLLEVIAYAVAATGVFPGASISAEDIESAFGASAPALDEFLDGDQFLIFVSFAFPHIGAGARSGEPAASLAVRLALPQFRSAGGDSDDDGLTDGSRLGCATGSKFGVSSGVRPPCRDRSGIGDHRRSGRIVEVERGQRRRDGDQGTFGETRRARAIAR